MNPTMTAMTARRILTQLTHDRRTIAMLMGAAGVDGVRLRYVFNSKRAFARLAPSLLGIFHRISSWSPDRHPARTHQRHPGAG